MQTSALELESLVGKKENFIYLHLVPNKFFLAQDFHAIEKDWITAGHHYTSYF